MSFSISRFLVCFKIALNLIKFILLSCYQVLLKIQNILILIHSEKQIYQSSCRFTCQLVTLNLIYSISNQISQLKQMLITLKLLICIFKVLRTKLFVYKSLLILILIGKHQIERSFLLLILP